MPKKKRTYPSETLTPSSLRLQPLARDRSRLRQQRADTKASRRSLFTPELIARLTERIKKL